MTYPRHPGVDAYLAALPGWQRDICQRLRTVAHDADPELAETIKRTVQPYFVLQGNVCALLGTKDHVNLVLYDGGLAPDPYGIITGGHGNSTGRTIAFYQGGAIPDEPLLELLRAIIADNRAGGWRRIKAQG
ncbi:MAG: DUF1801 domain-containing protein [Propionibacteriaceae bacterium]